jgi:hypothetical protein
MFSKYVYSVSTSHDLFLITVGLNNQIMHFLRSVLTFRSVTEKWPTMAIPILDTFLRTQLVTPLPFPPPTYYPAILVQCPSRKTLTIFSIKQYLTDDFSSKNSLEEWSNWLR